MQAIVIRMLRAIYPTQCYVFCSFKIYEDILRNRKTGRKRNFAKSSVCTSREQMSLILKHSYTPKGFSILFTNHNVEAANIMHLKPATSCTHIQSYNEQDMGFSMLSQSGQRGGFISFPGNKNVISRIPVKKIFYSFPPEKA